MTRPGSASTRDEGAEDGGPLIDPCTGAPAQVRRIQPYQAVKRYLCPGCNQEIGTGTGHFVVIPEGAADLRRHWHAPCWDRRHQRRPGRSQPVGHQASRRRPPAAH